MIENLPTYLTLAFLLTTIATLLLFVFAIKQSTAELTRKKTIPIVIGLIFWLIIQAVFTLNNLYKLDTNTFPPKLMLIGVLPTVLIIILLFSTLKGIEFIDSLPLKNLTYLHVIRIPVEIILFWLFLNKAIPELMTFEGRNFDILAGITAPFIVYFGLIKTNISRKLILIWNFICLALLLNIVINAIFSAPSPIQLFAFNQPNIAILNFPFSWLPTFIVPIVLFAHLASIRQLIKYKTETKINAKKIIIIVSVVVGYVFICKSCVMMRTSANETKVFFENSKIDYMDKSFVEGDNKIHYIQTGNKNNSTVLFIHGSPGSWDSFKNYLKDTLLLKKFRLIAIDRPGFGYSNFRKAQNLETQSKNIITFIKAIDNKKTIILVGHSMGGPVITKLAVDNPTMFSNLIILSGAIDPKAETPEIWRPIIKAFPLRYLIPGALRPSNDELWWLKKDLVQMKPNLKNIISNVTVIHGTKDPFVPFSNVAYIKNEFVNASSMVIIPIEKANHFIPWEHYDLIRNVIFNLKIE